MSGPDGDPVLIFVHIPKCGGTTFNQILKNIYGEALLDHNVVGDRFNEMDAADLRPYRAFTAHLRYGTHAKFERPARYISLLRNPLDNFVSFYNDITQKPGHFLYEATKNMALEEFFEYLDERDHPVLRNRQCLHISNSSDFEAARDLVERQYFLVTTMESYDGFVAALAGRLAWVPVSYAPINVSRKRVSPVDVPTKLRHAIEDRNANDLKLYNLVKAHGMVTGAQYR